MLSPHEIFFKSESISQLVRQRKKVEAAKTHKSHSLQGGRRVRTSFSMCL